MYIQGLRLPCRAQCCSVSIFSSSGTWSSELPAEGVTASWDKAPHSRPTADLVDAQDMTFPVLKQNLSVFAHLTVPSGVL